MARVVIEKLSKIFKGARGEPVCAVNGASLTVEDRELLVLVGPSGCGKTTTLRLIAGLEEATAGTIAIDGQAMNGVPPKDRDIAMVFQQHALYPHMTVYENLAFGLKLRRFPQPEIEQRVREAAGWLALTPVLGRRPSALSGGERQRVAVGRALVRRPKVFLFDEPLSNLDAPLRVQMRAELVRLRRRLAATMIYVTHDQAEAMTMGDRLAVMRDGVIQQVAPPMQLYNAPANLFVAGFLGSPPMNFFHGALVRQGSALHFAEENAVGKIGLRLPEELASRLQSHAGRSVVLGLRPESFSLQPPPSDNTIAATVEAVEPTGAETHLHLTTRAHGFIARVPAGESAAVNQRLSLAVDLRRACFFDPASEAAIV